MSIVDSKTSPGGVLITGATGLLGRALMQEFTSKTNLSITGTGFSRAVAPIRKLDLGSLEAIQALLDEVQPSLLIHAAADRRPDSILNTPEAAELLNVGVSEWIAQECSERGIKLVYISTDYVFDGTAPPYATDAKTNPLQFYGQTKARGEEVTLARCSTAVVLRVPILYGQIESLEESAITILTQKVLTLFDTTNTDSFTVDAAHTRFPTHVESVAEAVVQLTTLANDTTTTTTTTTDAKRSTVNNNVEGIYHFSGQTKTTKYDICLLLADLIAHTLGVYVDKSRIVPVTLEQHLAAEAAAAANEGGNKATRPLNAALDCSKLLEAGVVVEKVFFPDKLEAAIAPFI